MATNDDHVNIFDVAKDEHVVSAALIEDSEDEALDAADAPAEAAEAANGAADAGPDGAGE